MMSVLNQLNIETLYDIKALTAAHCVGIAGHDFVEGEKILLWNEFIGQRNMRFQKIRLRPGRGIAGIVYKTAKPWYVQNVSQCIEHHELRQYPILISESIESFIALPLIYNDRVEHVLLLGYRNPIDIQVGEVNDMIEQIEQISHCNIGGLIT